MFIEINQVQDLEMNGLWVSSNMLGLMINIPGWSFREESGTKVKPVRWSLFYENLRYVSVVKWQEIELLAVLNWKMIQNNLEKNYRSQTFLKLQPALIRSSSTFKKAFSSLGTFSPTSNKSDCISAYASRYISLGIFDLRRPNSKFCTLVRQKVIFNQFTFSGSIPHLSIAYMAEGNRKSLPRYRIFLLLQNKYHLTIIFVKSKVW